jgi:hypothetical protein
MKYRVKVVEKHCDYVWVEAESASEAEDLAPKYAECEYELLYSCEATGEYEFNKN